MTAQPSRVNRWLMRIALLFAIAILGIFGFLGIRLIQISYRVENSVNRLSQELERTGKSLARLSEELDKTGRRLGRVEAKAEQAIGLDDLEHLLGEVVRLRQAADKAGVTPLSTTQQEQLDKEMTALLESIYESDRTFYYDDEEAGGTYLYYKFRLKASIYGDTIRRAEDFIERVATKTMEGRTYYIGDPKGRRTPLKVWLTQKLTSLRNRP